MDRHVTPCSLVMPLASLPLASVYSNKGFYTLDTRAAHLVCCAVSTRARIVRTEIPMPLFVS